MSTIPQPHALAKAQLIKIDVSQDGSVTMGVPVIPVQFNPESLSVDRNKELGGGRAVGTLTVTLWYDVTALGAMGSVVRDVQALTAPLHFFIKPDDSIPRRHGVRFLWGTFWFDGWVKSISENFEHFAAEGMPLRASVKLTITNQGMWKGSR